MKKLALVIISTLAAGVVSADMTKYTDFGSYTNGKILADQAAITVDGWIKSADTNEKSFRATVTNVAGNAYLLEHHFGALTAATPVFQSGSGFNATAANDGYQTLFFRFMIDSSFGTAGKAGVSIAANNTTLAGQKAGFFVNGAGALTDLSNVTRGTVALNQWYDAWLVVDHRGASTNAGSNASLYLQSATDANYATQTQVAGNFYFGVGTANYNTIMLYSDTLAGLSTGIDDIYYDNTGVNLVDPTVVPEPHTISLFVISSVGLIMLRRSVYR